MCVNAETEINYSQIQLVLDFRYTFVRYIAEQAPFLGSDTGIQGRSERSTFHDRSRL